MSEYILTAKPGYSLEDAIERPSSQSAVIVKYERGLREEYIEWNLQTANMYNPKPDPRFFKQRRLVMRAGEQALGEEIPPGMLTAGMNPFYQIIYHIVERGGITSEEDIIRSLLGEERVFSASEKNVVEVIRGLLDRMNKKKYYILRHEGQWKVGFELPKAYHLVEYQRGYDPFEYHIMRYIEGRGLVSLDEIYGYIMEYLQWLVKPTKVDYYVKRLIGKGNVVKVQRNFFRYSRPLESNK